VTEKRNKLTNRLLRRYRPPALKTRLDEIQTQYQEEIGRGLLEAEQALINSHLETVFGFHLMQLSTVTTRSLFDHSTIKHCFVAMPAGHSDHDARISLKPASSDSFRADAPNIQLYCDNEQLPFENDALDAVILHHSLDYCTDPHRLLQEIQRVVRPGGHILTIAFNPYSWFGFKNLISRFTGNQTWNNQLISASKLADWLTLLELPVKHAEYAYYRVPYKLPHKLKSLINKIGQVAAYHQLPIGGGVYILLAKNEARPITPSKKRWKVKPSIVTTPGHYYPRHNDKTIH